MSAITAEYAVIVATVITVGLTIAETTASTLTSTKLSLNKNHDNFSDFLIWTANPEDGTVTGYSPDLVLVKTIIVPPIAGSDPAKRGQPTGIVCNKSDTDFLITDGIVTPIAATLIVVTQEGSILGYNPLVDPDKFILINTYLKYDFKGLAIFNGFLYATNYLGNPFSADGDVIKFDNEWNIVDTPGKFKPNLNDTGDALTPFGISIIRGLINVTYVNVRGNTMIPVRERNPTPGPGFGVVNQFDASGFLIRRSINPNTNLNVPYGSAQVRGYSFPDPETKVLVSNSGSGSFELYDFVTGKYFQGFQDNRLLGLKGMESIRSGSSHDGSSERFYFAGGLTGPQGNIGNGFVGYVSFHNSHDPCDDDSVSSDSCNIKLKKTKSDKKSDKKVKANKKLSGIEIARTGSRLSVSPVSLAHFELLVEMGS